MVECQQNGGKAMTVEFLQWDQRTVLCATAADAECSGSQEPRENAQ